MANPGLLLGVHWGVVTVSVTAKERENVVRDRFDRTSNPCRHDFGSERAGGKTTPTAKRLPVSNGSIKPCTLSSIPIKDTSSQYSGRNESGPEPCRIVRLTFYPAQRYPKIEYRKPLFAAYQPREKYRYIETLLLPL